MTQESRHLEFMNLAIDQAKIAYSLGEVPIGAVIVKNDEVIACSYNQTEHLQNPIGHAELLVIESASKKLNTRRLLDCTLYVTLEPCAMCAGAILQSHISEVIFAAYDIKSGALGSRYNIITKNLIVKGGIMEIEAQEILGNFFKKLRE